MATAARSTAIGKLLLLLAFGGVSGYCYHQDAASRRSEGFFGVYELLGFGVGWLISRFHK